MGERIFIENARLSYPHLFVPRAMEEGKDPTYQASFIIPKNHPAVAQILATRERIIAAEFTSGKQLHKDIPMRDGDMQGAPGCYIINSAAKQKPHTVDQNVQPILNAEMLYPGCFVNASLSLYAYFRPTGNGIAFGLDGVQFRADGERLDSRPSVTDLFQPVPGAPAPVAPGFASTTTAPVAPFPPAGSTGGWTP